MLIGRVILKNYRIHANKEIIFEKGINLLLGQNGSGKSSILEAIGLALFDAELRSSQADAIKKGEKSASIIVEFTGNDDKIYIVEKKLGIGPLSRLYLKGDKSSRIEGREAVTKKVMEVCGIISNEKRIYQNVITAYQNKIISIFAERPTEREKIFDTIFDTDIYRQIYEKYLKTAKDRYSDRCKIEKNNLLNIEEQLKDHKELKTLLKNQKNEHKELSKKLKDNSILLKKEEACKKQLEDIKLNIEKLNINIAHSNELLKTRLTEKNKTNQQLNESQKALAIVKNNHDDYNNYLKLDKKLKELTSQIIPLEKLVTEITTKKDELNQHERNKQSLVQTCEYHSKEKKEKESILEKNNHKLIKEKAELANLELQLEQLKIDGLKIKKINDDFEIQFEKINEFKNKENELFQHLKLLQKELPDLKQLTKHLVNQENIKSNLQTEIKTKENLERDKQAAQTRLSETEAAEIILNQKICPYLNEECLNLKNNSSTFDYFKAKKLEIKSIITSIDKELGKYNNLKEKLEKSIKDISLLNNKHEQAIKDNSKIKELNQDLQLINKNLEIAVLKIRTIINPIKNDLEKSFLENDFTAIKDALSTKYNHLREEYRSCDDNIKKIKTQLNELDNENQKINSDIKNIIKATELSQKKINQINELSSELSAKIKQLFSKTDALPLLKKEATQQTNLLENLKDSYNNYLSNKAKAEEIENIKKNIFEINTEIENLEKQISTQKNKLIKLESQFSPKDYQIHLDKIKTYTLEKEQFLKTIGEIEIMISHSQKELQTNQLLQDNYQEKKIELAQYENKLKITDLFRNNIKGMGKLVALRLINKIEQAASLNYQKISGKSEEIRWINSDKESYAVYLMMGNDLNNSRSFEQLSGGEQVAVALSLRAAMASILTNSHFAIFDEPTINLDREKRLALAESTKYIFKNLDQAIIVTHDDTFREMAQKTIILE